MAIIAMLCPMGKRVARRFLLKQAEPRIAAGLALNIMETIQIFLDRRLLQATDRAAPRTRQNRSALVRDALR